MEENESKTILLTGIIIQKYMHTVLPQNERYLNAREHCFPLNNKSISTAGLLYQRLFTS